MRKISKWFVVLAGVAMLVMLGIGGAMAADTIKLGVAGAHSGDLASYGSSALRGAEFVVEQLNAKGGILGKKVEIVAGDEQCKPELSTNVATKMVADKVALVMGHICSGATKAALPIYKDAKMVVMSPSATNPPLTQSGDYPNFFRTIASDDAQAKVEVEFAKKKGFKKLAVLHDKGDYGKGLAEFAKGFIEADKSLKLVLYEGITPGAVDYSAVIQKIKQSGAEAVIFGGYHPEASKLVSGMRSKKMNIVFISDDGVKDDTFIKVAGKSAEGVFATGPKDVSKNALAIEATAWHKAKYNADPGAFFLTGVAATQALLNAVAKTSAGDYEALRKALRNELVDTPLGKIKFDDRGDAVGVGFSVFEVKNGVYVEVAGK